MNTASLSRYFLMLILALPGCGVATVPIPVALKPAEPEQAATAEPAAAQSSEDAVVETQEPSATPQSEEKSVPLAEEGSPRVGIPTFSGGLPELRYRFKEGASYAYKVQIEADVLDTLHTHSGRVTLTARANKSKPTEQPKEQEKPTATAFAVTADGYLLTCAHVVEGAATIEVSLGGKTYSAKVIATDTPNDLALVKVDGSNLPLLPLANSDEIEVGQEIRAIGFPLSSVLGSSLKAVRGTVSGIDTRDGRKRIQIDAGVNPGNSGGPLVNEQGQVVGITSAKLTGSVISNVGFGVPVNDAKLLLAKHKVSATNKSGGTTLDGPTLVKTVSPAVGLVTVVLRDGVTVGGETFTLSYSGHLSESQREKNPQPFRPGAFPRMPRGPSIRPPSFNFGSRQANEVVVDALGNIEDSRGGESLPFMLGNASHLILEPLSEHGEQSWETTSTTTIIEREKDDDRFGPGFLRPRFGPRGFAEPQEPEGTKYTAVERTEYRVVRKDGDVVVLHKSYELKTQSKAGEDPYLKLTGEADINFDLKEGVPVEMTYKGTVSVNKQNVSVKIPLTFTYKKLTPEELKPATPAVAANPAKPADGTARPAPAKPEPKELTADEIDKHLAALQSNHFPDRHAACRAFQAAVPTEDRRQEVASGLEAAVGHDDLHTRTGAIKALVKWGGKDNVPTLIACLQHKDVFTRNEALDALTVLGDERAVDDVIVRFKDFGSRRKAVPVLKKIGPACEPALVKLLDEEKDLFLRKEVCDLLKEIGTDASVASLKVVARDSNLLLSQAAEAAIKAISER